MTVGRSRDLTTGRCRGVGPLLAASAVALVATHWLRLLPLGVAAPGATRYEDFVDLLTPYVVAGPALAALARTDAGRRTWVAALLATVAFTQGHGLHLAANSIAFARGPAAPVHLWDEQVGHHLWFAGLALLVAAVATAVRGLVPSAGPLALVLAGLVGVTWAANVVEGGAVPFGSALAVALAGQGWIERRHPLGRLLVVAFVLSLALIAGWGLWQGGFPQPSELGWL